MLRFHTVDLLDLDVPSLRRLAGQWLSIAENEGMDRFRFDGPIG
jgi:hypothetical protein